MRPAKEVHYTKKMTLDQVLTFSFSNLFKQFGAYSQWLLLSLIIVVVNLIPVGIVLMGIDFSGNIPVYAAPEEIFNNVDVGMIGLATVFFIVAILIDIFFAFYSSAWFYRAGLDGYDDIKRSFGERINVGFKDLGPVAAASLLIGIIVFAFMLPYLVTNMIGTLSENAVMEGISVVLYVIYLVAVYIISVRLSCVFGLILDGNEGVIESIKTSWAMTKGRFWRIFGYMLLIGILAGLLILVLVIPLVILWTVTAVANFTPALLGITIIFSIVGYMVMICMQLGISTSMPIAVYKLLCIEHAEDLPTSVETEGTTVSLSKEASSEETSTDEPPVDKAPMDDEIKF